MAARTSRRSGPVAAAAAVALVLGAGGYLVADAHDVVPGFLTLEPVPPPPSPFPVAPAAQEPPPLEIVLPPVDVDVPVPDAQELTALARAAADHEWMGDSVGIVVADQLTGEVLVDVDGDRPRTPASTAKMATGFAAVRALGPDARLATTVVQAGSGRLVLVGGGDVMLAQGAGDPTAVNGHAGLADLADQVVLRLELAGVDEVALDVDDTFFTGPRLAPGWADTDLSGGFVAPVTALMVNIAKTREEPYPPRHRDPSLHAAQVLAAALEERGVTVTGAPTRTEAPEGATVLGMVESATLRDVVAYSLQTSDNTVSEALGRVTAHARGLPTSFQGATRAVIAEMTDAGLDTTGAVLADCSGLADGSWLPARLLVDLVVLSADPTDTATLPVAVDMPVAGWQGTLAERLTSTPARGLVRAKTGSLRGVTSLSGTVVTVEGRPLVFAVLADQTPPGGQLGPRRVIDTFVQQLAGCGCGLP
ncbi:D-alanyl-D-alanine carboxypeptidase/D-alanyl-D-alanine endopeptidase [Cellulomonas bogoriensis]|uniref:D-alanyl-D-alanine carboxypeptidase n=1 Tax=Cellulomonas bogoriensis 69B4 = DSM 16987 TaxID=1386082 RepID=A0A0A0BKR6_9CELL|nr:D-alanyl-D-alanine carboxypeptidase/D-alanyl-D-alanine-endopeptidase [Cellulomonas bogoriensis]KGM09123.1 D-alanyl-D-alanine carboxypeptidase [Cellulomonas bogoriensis 69B4 = DSM 16987]